jgi:mono/diheme cytochrome c family protein
MPLVVAGLVVLAAACQQSQDEVDEGAPVDTAAAGAGGAAGGGSTAGGGSAGGGEGGGGDVALANQVYEANCATCHGPNGGGDGPAGAGLQPPPANFTDAEWKYGGDLESVKNTIRNGVPGTAMIPWQGTLTDAEIDAVAKHEIAFSQGQ